MPATVVEAKIPATDQEISVEYDFGSDLAEATERFGADVVFSNFKASCTVTLQGFIRGQLKADKDGNIKSDEEVIAAVSGWMPGQRSSRGKSKAEKLKDLIAGMTEEDIAALLSEARSEEG